MAERRQRGNGGEQPSAERQQHSAGELNQFRKNLRGLIRRFAELDAVISEGENLESTNRRLVADNEQLSEANATLLKSVHNAESRLANLEETIAKELRDARARHVDQIKEGTEAEIAGVRRAAEQEIATLQASVTTAEGSAKTRLQALEAQEASARQQMQELQRQIGVLQQTRDALRSEVMAGAS